MNKSELVDAVAEKTGLSKKDVAGTIDAFQDVIGEAMVKRDKVDRVGFGTFQTSDRKARVGINPSTDIRWDSFKNSTNIPNSHNSALLSVSDNALSTVIPGISTPTLLNATSWLSQIGSRFVNTVNGRATSTCKSSPLRSNKRCGLTDTTR